MTLLDDIIRETREMIENSVESALEIHKELQEQALQELRHQKHLSQIYTSGELKKANDLLNTLAVLENLNFNIKNHTADLDNSVDEFGNKISDVLSKLDKIAKVVMDIPEMLQTQLELLLNIPIMFKTLLNQEIKITQEFLDQVDDEYKMLTNPEFEYYNDPLPSWYDHDYSRVSKEKGIAYYMGRKIRFFLKPIFEKKGFPIRFMRDLHFNSFLGLQVPSGWHVYKTATMNLWENNESKRWRKVIIYFGGMEVLSTFFGLAGAVPYGSTASNNARMRIREATKREHKVWGNLAYASFINDGIITANWTEVCDILDENGY